MRKYATLWISWPSMLLMILAITATGCAATAPPTGTAHKTINDQKIRQMVENGAFDDLLENAEIYGVYTKNWLYDISDPVAKYIAICCKTKQQAIRLLERNNFRVAIGDNSYNAYPPGSSVRFMERICGEKSGKGFLYFDSGYRVCLYANDNEVGHVSAIYGRSAL